MLAGAALRGAHVAHPAPPRSADERAYLALARDLARDGAYRGGMREPWHWSPGAPALFAGAERLTGTVGAPAPRAVYAAQALAGTLAILAAFAAAALLAGPSAGVAAAAGTALYPPLVAGAGQALSEPLAGLALALGLVALVEAARRPAAWRFGLAGVLLGLASLVRADLLVAVPFVAAWAVLARRRPGGWPRALAAGGALLAGALVAVGPWVLAISGQAGRFVPVSTSGPSALYVGSYLPGHGTLFGFKRTFGNELRLEEPRLARVPNAQLPQGALLALVAARDPGLREDDAIGLEARRNLRRYALGHPLAYAGMLAAKAARMWSTPYRGTAARRSALDLAVHVAVVGLALAGLLAGLLARRGPPGLGAVVAVALASTAVNAVFLSEPRHLVPLAPTLFAAGAAGWALAARRWGPARRDAGRVGH